MNLKLDFNPEVEAWPVAQAQTRVRLWKSRSCSATLMPTRMRNDAAKAAAFPGRRATTIRSFHGLATISLRKG